MHYVGLDVHAHQSTYCVLDGNGKVFQRRTVFGPWHKLISKLDRMPKPFAVCYEASLGYGFLYDRLSKIAERVEVANTSQLRLIFRSKHKNDRADAEKLAKLLFIDQVPVIHVPKPEIRAWRSIIEHRHSLVSERTRIKNGLRAILRSRAIVPPMRLWTKAGITWLAGIDLDSDLDALRRDMLLERLCSVEKMVARVEKTLDARGTAHPGVRLLMTIPGVGLRTAEAVMAYIDEPGRFTRNKAVGRYFGLVPTQDASSRKNHLGHITKEGSPTVRKLLVEAAWQGKRRSRRIKAFYERILRDDKQRKKIAIVATAHYILRCMLAMLTTGEVWRNRGTDKIYSPPQRLRRVIDKPILAAVAGN